METSIVGKVYTVDLHTLFLYLCNVLAPTILESVLFLHAIRAYFSCCFFCPPYLALWFWCWTLSTCLSSFCSGPSLVTSVTWLFGRKQLFLMTDDDASMMMSMSGFFARLWALMTWQRSGFALTMRMALVNALIVMWMEDWGSPQHRGQAGF